MYKFLIFFTVLITANISHAQKLNNISTKAKRFIKTCADSINNLKQGGSIPYFVYDALFDYKTYYWQDKHHPIPLRKLVVDKIKNKNSIERILTKDNEALYRKHTVAKNTIGLTYYVMPYIEKSFGDLLKDRLERLNK